MAFKQGDKIKYVGADGKKYSGFIHGIRTIDTPTGEKVISYLVDTGNDEFVIETLDAKGKPASNRQPENVDVRPDQIEAHTGAEKLAAKGLANKGANDLNQPPQAAEKAPKQPSE